jgi:hypothetical protein
LLSPPQGDLAVARPGNGRVHRGRRQHLRWQSAGARRGAVEGKSWEHPRALVEIYHLPSGKHTKAIEDGHI